MTIPFKQYDRSYCQTASCRAFPISTRHNSIDLHSCPAALEKSKARNIRPVTVMYFLRCRIPATTTPGPAIHQKVSPVPTRSNCYWTPEADVSESDAEDIGTWWLTVFTLFASMCTSSRAIARKPGKALVATVVLPGTAVITGLRSCLCRTTG